MGSSCNACIETDARRASIRRYRGDGSGAQAYATGLRNAVGFDWRPGTDELYATDNGRDLLGDAFPPDELDLVVEGGFYGWPFANGDRVLDPDLGAGHEKEAAASIPPVHSFRPHNAALGITFVRGEKAPAAYRGAALVALHGSWNRTKKDGYKVVSLHWDASRGIEERDFLTGFEKDDDVIGRPVDVAEGPDGSFYVSDDYAGSIFRVAPGKAADAVEASSAAPPAAADPLHGMAANESKRRAAKGQELFVRMRCGGCHETAAPPPGVVVKPLTGLASRYDMASLAAYLRTPNPPMPVFPFTDAEREDVAVYLLTRR
jgi:cytochrome c553